MSSVFAFGTGVDGNESCFRPTKSVLRPVANRFRHVPDPPQWSQMKTDGVFNPDLLTRTRLSSREHGPFGCPGVDGG